MLTLDQYFNSIHNGIYRRRFKIEFLHPDSVHVNNSSTLDPLYCYSVSKTIEDDIIANQGNITVNFQSGCRRTVSITLINDGNKYDISPNNLWVGSKFKFYMGIQAYNDITGKEDEIFFPWGVYVLKNPTTESDHSKHTVILDGIDKYALLDNQLAGALQENYQINTYQDLTKNTPMTIGKAIRQILLAAGDPIQPYIEISYQNHIIPYIITADAGSNDTYDKVLSQVASICSANYYYDENGRFHFEKSLFDDPSNSKPTLYQFSINSPEYLGSSGSTLTNNFDKMYNVVKVIGNNVFDSDSNRLPNSIAINDNPTSDYSVNKVPYHRVKTITDSNISNDFIAAERARNEVKKLYIAEKEISFNSIYMPHINDVNQIIEITDPNIGFNNSTRLLINNLSVSLSSNSQFQIQASNVDDNGASLAPDINPLTGVDYYTTLLLHFDDTVNQDSINNTKLLLHFDNKKFVDSSNLANKVTNNGVIFNQSHSKFGTSSAYFNGKSSLNMTIPNFTLNHSFTIDMWVYIPKNCLPSDDILPYSYVLFNWGDNSYHNNKLILGKTRLIFDTGNSNIVIDAEHNFNNMVDKWSHIALVRGSQNDYYLLQDGSILNTKTHTLPIPNYNVPIYIGRRGKNGEGFIRNIYIDEYRISYQNEFDLNVSTKSYTLPTRSSGNLIDSGNYNLACINNGGVQIKSSPAKFGKSGYFHDCSVKVDLTDFHDVTLFDLNFDFTIESFIYITDWNFEDAREGYNLYHQGSEVQSAKTGDRQNVISIKRNTIEFRTGYAFNTIPLIGKHNMSLNTWYHFAMGRSGNIYTMYLDGKIIGQTTYNEPLCLYTGSYIYIGSYEGINGGRGGHLHAYLDEYRVSVGINRYIDEFTPPTSPFGSPI